MSRHAVKLSALFSPAADQGDWVRDALCAQVDPDLWFPERGENNAKSARAVCNKCPVIDSCREYALEHETRGHDAWGIWAALSVNQRRDILRDRGIAPPPPAARITAEDAEEIRTRYFARPRITQPELALQYGVSRSTIAHIVQGRTWTQEPA